MERKIYLGCCSPNNKILLSYRANEQTKLEKALEVQNGELENKTVMIRNLWQVNSESNPQSKHKQWRDRERKERGKSKNSLLHLARNCVEIATNQEVIMNFWTEENDPYWHDWHSNTVFLSNLFYDLAPSLFIRKIDFFLVFKYNLALKMKSYFSIFQSALSKKILWTHLPQDFLIIYNK